MKKLLIPFLLFISSLALGQSANRYFTYNTQASNYTFVLSDANTKIVQSSSLTGVTYTIDESVTFPVGAQLIAKPDTTGMITAVCSGCDFQDATAVVSTEKDAYMIFIKKAAGKWDYSVGGGGGSVSDWGDIGGTLSDQTDLQAALDLKANLASPTFTGVPIVPTAAPGTSTGQAASTAFVAAAVTAGSVADGDKGDITVSGSGTSWLVDNLAITNAKINDVAVGKITGMGTGVPTFLTTPSSANLATALTDETGTGNVVFSASPTFTGTPVLPTATTAVTQSPGDNTTKIATTAFVTAAGSAGTGDVRKRLGVVVNPTLDASAGSLYTDTSPQTTFTFTSGGITTSGGNNDALNFLEFTGYYTNVHKWTREIIFTPTSDGNGLGLGIHSSNGDQLARIIATGANKGKLLIDTYRSGTLTNRITSTAALSYTNTTDQLKLTLEKAYTNYRVTVQIVGTPASIVSIEWVDALAYPTVSSVWAVGRPAIYHFGGNQTITGDKYIVNELVQNQVATFSASLGAGAYAADVDNMWGVILAKFINTGVTIEAGGGNRTSDWANVKNEMLSLKPKIIIYDQGLNDVLNAIPLATSQANILTFIQDCLANNITPVFCELTHTGAGTATDVNAFNAWLNGLGYVKVIPINAAMCTGSVLQTIYDAGDGIHFNAAGNRQFAATVIASIKYIVNTFPAFSPSAITPTGFTDSYNIAGPALYSLTNTNTGTAAYSTIRANNSTTIGGMITYGTGYTGLTSYADKTQFVNNGGGVILSAVGASGEVNIMTGGTTYTTNSRLLITNASTTSSAPLFSQTNNQNGAVMFKVTNGTDGASSSASVRTTSSTANGVFISYAASYSPGTLANKTGLFGDAAGLIVGATGGSGIYSVITGGTDPSTNTRMNISASGTTRIGDGTAATSTLAVGGSFSTPVVQKTALYSIGGSDHTVEVTSGTHTQTLPTAVGIGGRMYVITNSGTGVVTVGTTSSQTFINVLATPTTLTLAQFKFVMVQSNGANWIVISQN